MTDRTATLQARIVKLERNVRTLTSVCVGLPLLILFLGADASENDSSEKKLTAEEFVLASADGDVRARLSTDRGHPRLVMYDNHKKPRILIGVTGRGGDPQVRVFSPTGVTQLLAEIDQESQVGAISFYHETGQFMGKVGGSTMGND